MHRPTSEYAKSFWASPWVMGPAPDILRCTTKQSCPMKKRKPLPDISNIFFSMRIYAFAGHLKFSPDMSGESGGFRVLCHLPSIRYMESDVYEPIVQVAEVGSTISDGFHLHPLNTCSLIWLSLISRQTKNTALRKKEKGTILYTHKNNTR